MPIRNTTARVAQATPEDDSRHVEYTDDQSNPSGFEDADDTVADSTMDGRPNDSFDDPDSELVTANNESIHDLIVAFLAVNKEPTDEQVHSLASSIGMDSDAFEAVLYAFLQSVVADDNDEDEDFEDLDESDAAEVEAALADASAEESDDGLLV